MATNLCVEDRVFPIRQYGATSPGGISGSQRFSSEEYWFTISGPDDGFFLGWSLTGTVKPISTLTMETDDGAYAISFDQVTCTSFYLSQASQDPGTPMFFGFSLSADAIRTVSFY